MEKILIIDIETTNFLQKGGKIVEVGMVELDLSNGEKKIVFDKVTHEKGITKDEVEGAWIIENSTLTVEDIRTSRRLDKLKPEIQEIIYEYEHGCTAFNNAFDFGFMEHRGFIFPNKLACPMKLATPLCKLPKSWGGGYKWPNVEEAYKFFFGETNFVEQHRGADDAYHEADIVYELFKRGIFKI